MGIVLLKFELIESKPHIIFNYIGMQC